jgi:hypothetical protein
MNLSRLVLPKLTPKPEHSKHRIIDRVNVKPVMI